MIVAIRDPRAICNTSLPTPSSIGKLAEEATFEAAEIFSLVAEEAVEA